MVNYRGINLKQLLLLIVLAALPRLSLPLSLRPLNLLILLLLFLLGCCLTGSVSLHKLLQLLPQILPHLLFLILNHLVHILIQQHILRDQHDLLLGLKLLRIRHVAILQLLAVVQLDRRLVFVILRFAFLPLGCLLNRIYFRAFTPLCRLLLPNVA